MASDTLEAATAAISAIWGPLGSELVAGCRQHLQQLVASPADQAWLAALRREAPASRELYRDGRHGFVLLAHTEPAGLYRPPHDHGRGWVIYALQQGSIEMGSYARIDGADGSVQLVKRDTAVLRAGQVQVYLPGDIHDTRCLDGPALLLRFTGRDLKSAQEAQWVKRYPA